MVLVGEQGAGQRQQLFAEAVGEQAVVTDAHEASGQNMEEEAAQELLGIEGHDALLVAVGMIPPKETDALTVEGGEAVVGDGHAMGIAAEMTQDMSRATEGRAGINVPVLVAQLLHQFLEPYRVAEVVCRTSAIEQASAIELAQASEELLAKDGAQDGNGQQEQRMAGRDPALMVG